MNKTVMAATLVLGLMIAMPAAAAKETPSNEAAQARQPIKIGIVDMQKITRESKAAKAIRSNFQKDLDARKATIQDKIKDVQTQEEELARLDPGTPVETRRAKADKLKHDTRDLNNMRQDVEVEVKQKEAEMTQLLLAEIIKVIRNYARNERYSLILERGTVVTAEESVDITDKILKILDSQSKKK